MQSMGAHYLRGAYLLIYAESVICDWFFAMVAEPRDFVVAFAVGTAKKNQQTAPEGFIEGA